MDDVKDLAASLTGRPHGTRWGPWSYSPRRMVLEHGPTGYEVDLADCRTSAAVLDWIVQVAGKRWADAACVGDLVRAIDSLLGLQARLCGEGIERGPLDVRALLRTWEDA